MSDTARPSERPILFSGPMVGDDALDLVADHPESWASKMEAALSKATAQQEGR